MNYTEMFWEIVSEFPFVEEKIYRCRINSMDNYLKGLCESLGISLVYQNNSPIVLYCTVNHGIPIIKAHNIFKDCPEVIANAIVCYYAVNQNCKEYLRVIKKYTDKRCSYDEYIIQPGNDKFKNAVLKNLGVTKRNKNAKSCFIEMDISSITQKSFWGDTSIIEPGKVVKAMSEDVLELEISVDYPDSNVNEKKGRAGH